MTENPELSRSALNKNGMLKLTAFGLRILRSSYFL